MAITCDGFRLRCSGPAIDEGGNGMSAGLEVSLLVVAVWILIIGWSYCQVHQKEVIFNVTCIYTMVSTCVYILEYWDCF
jgi:hypothetical protein